MIVTRATGKKIQFYDANVMHIMKAHSMHCSSSDIVILL